MKSLYKHINTFISVPIIFCVSLLSFITTLLLPFLKDFGLYVTVSQVGSSIPHVNLIITVITVASIIIGFAINRVIKLEEYVGMGTYRLIAQNTYLRNLLTVLTITVILFLGGYILCDYKTEIIRTTWTYISYSALLFFIIFSIPLFTLACVGPLNKKALIQIINKLNNDDLFTIHPMYSSLDSEKAEDNNFYLIRQVLIFLAGTNRMKLAEEVYLKLIDKIAVLEKQNNRQDQIVEIQSKVLFIYSISKRVRYDLTKNNKEDMSYLTIYGLLRLYKTVVEKQSPYHTIFTDKEAGSVFDLLQFCGEAQAKDIAEKSVLFSRPLYTDNINKDNIRYFTSILDDIIVLTVKYQPHTLGLIQHHIGNILNSLLTFTKSAEISDDLIRSRSKILISTFLHTLIKEIPLTKSKIYPQLFTFRRQNEWFFSDDLLKIEITKYYLGLMATLSIVTIKKDLIFCGDPVIKKMCKLAISDDDESKMNWSALGFLLKWYCQIFDSLKSRAIADYNLFMLNIAGSNTYVCKELRKLRDHKLLPNTLVKDSTNFNELFDELTLRARFSQDNFDWWIDE